MTEANIFPLILLSFHKLFSIFYEYLLKGGPCSWNCGLPSNKHKDDNFSLVTVRTCFHVSFFFMNNKQMLVLRTFHVFKLSMGVFKSGNEYCFLINPKILKMHYFYSSFTLKKICLFFFYFHYICQIYTVIHLSLKFQNVLLVNFEFTFDPKTGVIFHNNQVCRAQKM